MLEPSAIAARSCGDEWPTMIVSATPKPIDAHCPTSTGHAWPTMRRVIAKPLSVRMDRVRTEGTLRRVRSA